MRYNRAARRQKKRPIYLAHGAKILKDYQSSVRSFARAGTYLILYQDAKQYSTLKFTYAEKEIARRGFKFIRWNVGRRIVCTLKL